MSLATVTAALLLSMRKINLSQLFHGLILRGHWSFLYKSSPPEVFLGTGVLGIYSRFKGKHPCRSVISIKMLCNLLKPHFDMGVNLLNIFRKSFCKNMHGWMLLPLVKSHIFSPLLMIKGVTINCYTQIWTF